MDGAARLFLALWPDEAERAALARWRDAWIWPPGAAPVPDAKLHLTLHFLGSQPSARLPEFLDAFAVPFTPFRIELGQPAQWPHGLAVLEPFAEPDQLLHLRARLSGALLQLGLAPEPRSYRPHVTMARRATGAMPPATHAPLAWQVERYALVRSQPASGTYTVLRTYF